jgi:acyl-CoA synthetase (AMP-forming)/AMP-acid ligase II
MRVPLTTRDFLDRAELIYGDRVGIVDEPSQPAPSIGEVTYREVARRARAMQAALDELGIGEGERVAVVSHNSGRLLEMLLGVPSSGRVLVPVNFRLSQEEVGFIVGHSGARVLMVDPELEASLKGVDAEHRFTLGEEYEQLLRFDTEPRPWAEPDEDATATINYTSGTTARPKGVQMTHRNEWVNAVTFAMHMQVSDRDVYLHTLPLFHCNGWGMPYATAGLGARQVVIRKIDGAEILRRVEQHGVTLMSGAPAVWNSVLDAAANWQGEIPGRDRVRIVVAGAPPPSRTIARIERELGWEFNQIYGLTECSPSTVRGRSTTTSSRRSAPSGCPARARRRSAPA